MRRLFTLLFCLFASPSFAAVAIDACTMFESASGCTTCDISTHTVAAGANYLVVFVGQDADLAATNILTATWDQGASNQSMGEVADNNGVGNLVGKAFTVTSPTSGNKTLRVTTTNGAGCCQFFVCSFTGVKTSSPLGTIVETESTSSATGDSLAFTLGTGGMAVAFLVTASAVASFAQGADQTQLFRAAGNGCSPGSDCDATLTWATVSPMNYTWSSTFTNFWHVVLPIQAATNRPVLPLFLGE